MSRWLAVLAAALTALITAGTARAAAPVEYYHLAPGFISESWDSDGVPKVDGGFSTPNPWGFYTAYLVATNDKGQRTWRIEDFLNSTRLAGTPFEYKYGQGSTMWLFEGSQRALLVDTAHNTPEIPIVPGQLDLVTVVKQLLGHDNTGAVKPNPVDFVVSNTHSHGDHIGKNAAMAPRTIYYPDGDWPNSAPANYVPIREGGGPTTHGDGSAVGQIDLGDRLIEAIDVHGHTAGSTAYLDRENRMIATGDAIGSAYVWAHIGLPMSTWIPMLAHLQQVIAPYPDIAILPAHFYQIKQFVRALPPLNGRPLDPQYVADQFANAEGIIDGAKIGEPYRDANRNVAWTGGASARMTFSFANLYPGGIFGGNGDPSKYHAITIPGSYKLAASVDAAPPGPAIDNIKTGFYLIRDNVNTSMYLIKGSTKALLVGTGSGTPGIAAYAKKLAGDLPLEVVVTSDDADQVGGLAQFAQNKVYLPAGAAISTTGLSTVSYLGAGDVIDLGSDGAGRPARIEVQPLSGHSKTGLTLLDVSDRALLSGDALGEQFNGGGLILRDTLARFDTALRAWRTKTDGRYDVVYTAHNYQWYTSPSYVDQVQQAVTTGLTGGDAATIPSVRPPGYRMIQSTGAADIVASVVLGYAETNASGSVGGSVAATLSLVLGSAPTFGAFIPGTTKDYTAQGTATVTSTAGDATLSVSDPSTAAPGHLLNGEFSLPSPLLVGGSPLPAAIKRWAGPVSNDPVSIAFGQHIDAKDALRTGIYSRTLTFTLSTTTP